MYADYHISSLLVLLVVVVSTHGCSPTKDWKPKSVTDLAEITENIVYGEAVAIYSGDLQITEFNIHCVLKNTTLQLSSWVVTISTDVHNTCVNTVIEQNKSYILFVKVGKDGDGNQRYETDEINLQSAALEPNDDNFKAVSRAVLSRDLSCNNETEYGAVTCFNAKPQDYEECNIASMIGHINVMNMLILSLVSYMLTQK